MIAERTTVTIGIAFPGSIDGSAWSGIPAGLREGLRAHGATVVHLRSSAPDPVQRVVGRLPGWRVRNVLDAVALSRAIRRERSRLDGILLVGSLVAPRTLLPVVTYEDMTVRQAVAVNEPFVVGRSRGEVEAWVARQQSIYERAAGVCTLGRWAADSVVADYGIPLERVHCVGAGVNHMPARAERDWSIPRFLFIGKDFQRKNGPAVLRAFAALREERPDATLDVVGGHPPLSQPGVTGHGLLSLANPDERARVSALLRTATCFVMPSSYEPFGIVYAEAAMAGVPSIATSVGGTFVDEDCGRRVDPADVGALLQAMRELSDGEVARRLGASAAERADAFTWPLVAGRVLRCFAEAGGAAVDRLPPYL